MLTNPSAASRARVLDARHTAAAACELALVTVVPVDSSSASRQTVDVLDAVWGSGPASLPAHLVRALADTGNYVVGLCASDRPDVLIGASVAFFADPASRVLHSHITGILPEHRGRHVGTAVKLDQRAWALERGIDAITWTYDPLVSRNAHFNLVRLGARADSFHNNFYGLMGDTINLNDATDRIHVTWSIDALWTDGRRSHPIDHDAQVLLEVGPRSEPLTHALQHGVTQVCVGIPRDIEAIRHGAPDLAQWWRQAIGEAFSTLLGAGFTVEGFSATGQYLFRAAA